ncbi:hypothetical protein H2201_006081 [Coniosporium apollinis]|uniref:Ribosome biogenesis protein Urb1 n=1 Tax=Coniosporium apollinis TaxID=61459 RepID=A0ABQ9NR47_9PEZI|nr:hypothetical protein H2201_006081 [Coniosporium apollinis]
MSKRPVSTSGADHSERPRAAKRQKIEGSNEHATKAEEIHSARQLQQLLVFQQDAVPQLRSGIQAFKTFLESILYPTDEHDVPRRRAILRDFLESQVNSSGGDETSVPSLIQAWSFAAQSNNDYLTSSITALLALLLKTVSTQLELRDYGLNICKTVLQSPQTKLIARSLSAPKHKEHVISPALRLLTEVVSFDGGTLARQVYSKRDFTFDVKILARNLSIGRASTEEGPEDRRKPSVRSNAVRYLLANLKYQDGGAKIDILKQGIVLRALFDRIRDDSPQLATDILRTVRTHVIQDDHVPRSSKSYPLTDRTLSNIAGLYRADESENEVVDGHVPISVTAHEFLLFVCTSPEVGVLNSSSGWYPPGTEKPDLDGDFIEEDQAGIDLGLDSIDWYSRYNGKVPIKNTTLASFAQGLRPYSNQLEQKLLLAIFEVAPELVADYFFKKNFPFDPKLTSTWIGYSSFLFSTIQLPVPPYFGRKQDYGDVPPPTAITIESILPRPLNQKVLTRCLNQNSELITFFAIRLLTVAFQKLQQILALWKRASTKRPLLWEQASTRLISEFCKRCPRMKDAISAYRRTPADKFMEREAAARLLAMYYEITPELALDEKFDVSMPLANVLAKPEQSAENDDENGIRLLELSHLVTIARHSPNMRWWNKPESLRFSPFTSLLKLVSSVAPGTASSSIRQLITSIVREQEIVLTEGKPSSLDALVASLQTSKAWVPMDAIFCFLDDCLNRYVRKPIKYQDDLDALINLDPRVAQGLEPETVSPLLMTMVEQWEFIATMDFDRASEVGIWIARLFRRLRCAGENHTALSHLRNSMIKLEFNKDCRHALKNCFEGRGPQIRSLQREMVASSPFQVESPTSSVSVVAGDPASAHEETLHEGIRSETPPPEDENHPGLHRWTQKDVEAAIEEGDVGELVLCLCSLHTEIRRQALSDMEKLVATLKVWIKSLLKLWMIADIRHQTSTYAEKQQVELLLSELIETAKVVIDDAPLPYIAGAFAVHALRVIADPAHVMYPKVNKFLNKGPSWNVSRLPSYWAEKVILNPPEEDDAYYKEIDWLLAFLHDGLRTNGDMDILRTRNTFERILALCASPFIQRKLKERVLRLVFRAAAVGGSTTLLTRSGLISWVQSQIALGSFDAGALRSLASRLYETAKHERVIEWSSGALKGAVEALAAA